MAQRAHWAVLVPWLAVVSAVLAAGSQGAFGPLAVCGADAATLCIAWPGIVDWTIWLMFMGTLVGLAVWQARHWDSVSIDARELALLGAVLLAAAAIRVWRSDLALVGYDEAAAASLIAAWRLDGLFPLTGIVSSIGIPNPPAWPYVLATLLLVWDSPYAVVLLGIATSLLSVVLVWWVARRWIGAWGALAGAVFYSFSFWSIDLGRGGWQPIYLHPPILLCLDALLLLAVRKKPVALVLACGWLGVMVQLHYIAGMFVLMLPLAMWPARRVLLPWHILAGGLVSVSLLMPFLVYELHPSIALRDVFGLASDAGGGAHINNESWDLFWTVAAGRGAAGIAGTDIEALQAALGRWSNLSVVGIPLVAFGAVAAVVGWPRGWRGVVIVAFMLTPVVGLARHTIGVIFHYLFLALPGMAVTVAAVEEWAALSHRRLVRAAVWVALAVYSGVCAASMLVVLAHVDRTSEYPAQARPLGVQMAAVDAVRAVRGPDQGVLIGGSVWRSAILQFGLGFGTPSRIFDQCGAVPTDARAIYLLDDDTSPAARALAAAGSPLLARVARADGAYVVYGTPSSPVVNEGRC